MLKKEAIQKTVVCSWSPDDSCFIAVSSLFPRVLGTGESREEALQDFTSAIEEAYQDIADGNVRGYDKRGRPAKGRTNMHVQVRPQTREFIDTFRIGLDISQGEVIDYLVSTAQAIGNQPEQECDSYAVPRELLQWEGNSVTSVFGSWLYKPCSRTEPQSVSFRPITEAA